MGKSLQITCEKSIIREENISYLSEIEVLSFSTTWNVEFRFTLPGLIPFYSDVK